MTTTMPSSSSGSQAARPRPRGHPDAPLQPADGGGVHALDSAVHRLPWQEAPVGDGDGRNLGVSDLAGSTPACQRVDAEPGAQRAAVSLLYGSGLRLQECLEARVKDV